MTMKRLAAYFIAILLPLVSSAEVKKGLTFGAEWGYIFTFYGGFHNNFFSPDGWRVDERNNGLCHYSNAEMYLHMGYNFSTNWNLSAYVGYTAIQNSSHCVPVSLRATRYFNPDSQGDRWLAFIDLGSGISIKKRPQEILAGKIGTGYRFSLSERTKLDLLASVRINYTHTDIIYENTMISYDRINRNNTYGSALSIGVSLSF